jgi:hypothetical protein
MNEHVCDLRGVWPVGHPLPPEDPAKLKGPDVGDFVLYKGLVVRVTQRSYVWSPGECRSRGGYRQYDSKVIEEGPNGYRSIVVNDSDLAPLPAKSAVTYRLRQR